MILLRLMTGRRGCLKTGSGKNRKKFDFELEKIKNGDILRIRCVLSATMMLDRLLKAVRNKKLKNFQNRACKNKNWWYIKKLLPRNGVS